ncbi:hypothetical protein M422DRAFT_25844, partial [Sphaerobolus stellatus SS14]
MLERIHEREDSYAVWLCRVCRLYLFAVSFTNSHQFPTEFAQPTTWCHAAQSSKIRMHRHPSQDCSD